MASTNSQKRRRASGGSVTIREVAARAAVSTMTVSRVINSEGMVRTETRERVEAAIRELNFTPNGAARRLAAARHFKLALLYDNPSAGFMTESLLGALHQSSQISADLLVLKHEEDEAISALVEAILSAGVEGVILPPPLCEFPEAIQSLQSAGITCVGVAAGRANTRMSTIRMDNEHAAREVADYLLSLGHQTFGFIGGAPNQSVSEQRRWGFIDQLGSAGISAADIHLEAGHFNYKSGLEAAQRLLSLRRRPTAIFAANDDMAAAALATAHRLGIDAPKHVSIVGFDDTAICGILSPTLTTIRQPVNEMAAAAVIRLAEELRRRRSGESDEVIDMIHGHALVVRESTGSAPKD